MGSSLTQGEKGLEMETFSVKEKTCLGLVNHNRQPLRNYLAPHTGAADRWKIIPDHVSEGRTSKA
jgi:hypothetical protein